MTEKHLLQPLKCKPLCTHPELMLNMEDPSLSQILNIELGPVEEKLAELDSEVLEKNRINTNDPLLRKISN